MKMFAPFQSPKYKLAAVLAIGFLSMFFFLGLNAKRDSGEVVSRQFAEKEKPQSETLKGEEADEKLRNDPRYKSLQEAIQESFYRVEKDPTGKTNAYYANNRSQRLSMKFENGEAVLNIKVSEPKDEKKADSSKDQTKRLKQITARAGESRKQVETKDFKVRFVAAGYGDNLQKVSGESEISFDNNRLTYKHKLENTLIEEWYVNKSSGIEHGFTLSEPPALRDVDDYPFGFFNTH